NQIKKNEKTKLIVVVKADAYGHGIINISKIAQEKGANILAVNSLCEAVTLRKNGISIPILILGFTDPNDTNKLIKHQLIQSIHSVDMARKMSNIAQKYK